MTVFIPFANLSELFDAAVPVDWQHKEEFHCALSAHESRISEWTFSNLFAWRRTYPRRVIRVCEHLLAGYEDRETGSKVFLQPVGPDPARVIIGVSELGPAFWHRVDMDIGRRVAELSALQVCRDVKESDYIYDRAELAALAGPRYAKLRGRAGKCEREYRPEIKPLSPETLGDCREVVADWLRSKDAKCNGIHERDAEACEAILDAAERLPLCGIVVYIEGHPKALVCGEQLASGVYVSHFEKSDLRFTGISVYAFREWARRLPDDCRYINRMQDQNDEGLRSWKRSWQPVRMVEKCQVHSA